MQNNLILLFKAIVFNQMTSKVATSTYKYGILFLSHYYVKHVKLEILSLGNPKIIRIKT